MDIFLWLLMGDAILISLIGMVLIIQKEERKNSYYHTTRQN